LEIGLRYVLLVAEMGVLWVVIAWDRV